MSILNNGKEVCDCLAERVSYGRCDVCGAEVEICERCRHVRASDCEHYDILLQGISEGGTKC